MADSSCSDTVELSEIEQLTVQLYHLCRLVKELRVAQPHALRIKKPVHVQEAMRLEKAVDDQLDVIAAIQHPDLFSGTGNFT